MFKISVRKHFSNFYYFYDYLGIKVFIGILLSILVGLFDGLGLALFIPLIQLSTGNHSEDIENLDRYSQWFIRHLNFELSLLNIFLLILILFSLKGLFKFADLYFRVWSQQLFMRKIRNRNIDLLRDYNFQRFTNFDTGRIQNVMGAETNRVSQAYGKYFKTLHYAVLVFVYVTLAMLSSVWFSLIVIFGGIILNFLFSSFYKRTKYFSQNFSKESNSFQGLLMQKINNFQYLKATGSAHKFSFKLKQKVKRVENIQLKLGVYEAILGAVREPLTILVVFGSIFVFLAIFAETLSSIILSLLLLYRSVGFFAGMQEHWNAFLGTSGSLENVQSFSDELMKHPEKSGENKFENFERSLKLSNVSFSYNSSEVLKDISLELFRNETLAIVGESGSGKTTLMNILAGILEVDRGSYFVDDHQFSDLEINSFRGKTGYIVQDPVVFNDTLFNNISFWDEKNPGNLSKMFEASKKAALSPFIESLELKEDTILGFNGVNISGGQKQRLSIARELYKDAEILFMDEATSNLDSETEYEVQSNIANLKGKFTILIIAHRLSTVKNADRIVLLKKGRIEKIGSYDELLETSREFRRMVELQEL